MARHAWKLDKKLTAMMVEDFIFDPILAAKVILRIKVPPHEELRILWMWTTYYTNDDSGFSTGKSFTHAIISGLRSILFPRRVSGILSKTFAQGQLIFKNFDNWYGSSPIFRFCIKHSQGKERLVHSQTAFQAFFRGGSEVRVLPPSFMQDAERLRSERWNDGYFDEWTTFGRFEAFNKTIIGRVTKDNQFPDCPIRQNHIHLSSTPGFKHQPAYQIVKRIDANVASGNPDYGRFSCNYRHVPTTEEWRWLVNRKVIFTMQSSLPQGIVKSEIDGFWQDDSMSFYSAKNISETRFGDVVTSRDAYPEDAFIAGVDVARGGSDASRQNGDDFSLSVYRIRSANEAAHHCLTVRYNNVTADQMAGIVQHWNKIFRFAVIVYDPGGGGLFVRDSLRKTSLVIGTELQNVFPLLEIGDNSGSIGDYILSAFKRNSYFIERMWGKMASDSVMLNRAHAMFASAIDDRKVILGREWNGWENVGKDWDADAKRDFLNRNVNLSADEKIKAEMDLAISQLCLVDVERDENSVPMTDSYGMYKFLSKSKKDSAYSLFYGFVGVLIYSNVLNFGVSAIGGGNSKTAISVSEI